MATDDSKEDAFSVAHIMIAILKKYQSIHPYIKKAWLLTDRAELNSHSSLLTAVCLLELGLPIISYLEQDAVNRD